MNGISAIHINSQISIFQIIKTSFLNTTCKVINFIKKNFFKMTAMSFMAAGIVFYNILEIFLAFSVIFAIISFISARSIEKIKTAPLVKRNVITTIHNSRAWLKVFKAANYDEKKIMLKDIGIQTLKSVENLGEPNVIYLSLGDIDDMKRNTQIIGRSIRNEKDEKIYFQEAMKKNKKFTRSKRQKIEIFEGKSLDVALHLKHKKSYQDVAVLNIANVTSPGGGFLSGYFTQEASLCRRSTLFDSINIDSMKGNFNPYLQEKMKGTYQIPEFGFLFSPSVQVFRGNINEGFPYYIKSGEVNVISSAAYDLKYNPKTAKYMEKTKIKLQMILNSALETGQDLVVLGAYGCDTFDNDPEKIVQLVKIILQERSVYQQKMKIVFAIDKKENIKRFLNLRNFVC